MSDSEQRYRLVVLGSGRVGKSSIIRRLLKDEFVESYRATIEDLHCREYDVDGATVKVDILDTAGNLEFPAKRLATRDDPVSILVPSQIYLEFPAMRRLSISTAHAFLLVYSIDDRQSFEEVRRLWEQIKEERNGYSQLPCVVAGNKVDLSDDENGKCRRKVHSDEVQLWAAGAGLDDTALLEVSAREGTDVLAVFHRLLSQATSSASVRRLEPLLRRRLSGNAARMNAARARLREKTASENAAGGLVGGGGGGGGPDGCGNTPLLLQVSPEPGRGVSRSRSLIRRVSKRKKKTGNDSLSRNDCVLS